MKWDFAFRPEWVDPLKNYSRHDAFQDTASGVRAGLVALPPARACGIAPGMKPQAGPGTP